YHSVKFAFRNSKAMIMKKIFFMVALFVSGTAAIAQMYNLPDLLKASKLEKAKEKITPAENTDKPGVYVKGIAWITGADFSTGTIDIDLRGRDVFQNSFIGVMFHAVDTVTYDLVYFRPFNFHSPDPERKVH